MDLFCSVLQRFCSETDAKNMLQCLKQNKNSETMDPKCKQMITKRQITQNTGTHTHTHETYGFFNHSLHIRGAKQGSSFINADSGVYYIIMAKIMCDINRDFEHSKCKCKEMEREFATITIRKQPTVDLHVHPGELFLGSGATLPPAVLELRLLHYLP